MYLYTDRVYNHKIDDYMVGFIKYIVYMAGFIKYIV